MKDIHEMIEALEKMGATKEDIIRIWKIALETTDKVIKGAN